MIFEECLIFREHAKPGVIREKFRELLAIAYKIFLERIALIIDEERCKGDTHGQDKQRKQIENFSAEVLPAISHQTTCEFHVFICS